MVRKAILDSAWVEFVARGYGEATVQRITDNARVSLATFYAHFDDKLAVFAAVLGEIGGSLSTAVASIEPETDMAEGLRQFGEACLGTFSQEIHVETVRLMYAEARRVPELAAVFQEQSTGWLNALGEFIGQFRPDISAQARRDLALLYAEMVAGRLHRERMLGLESLAESEFARHIQTCVSIFIHGLSGLE